MKIYSLPLLVFILCVGFMPVTAQQGEDLWDLQRCINYALENNLEIQQAGLGVESSTYTLRQSKESRLPNLNFNANFRNNTGYVADPFTNEFANRSIRSNDYSLSSSINVFSGFTTTNTIKRNEVDLMASQYDLEDTRNIIILRITRAYLAILLNKDLVENAEFQLATTQERRDRTEKLVKAGSLAMADLLELESQVATDEVSLVNARNQMDLAYLSLMQLLQLDPDGRFGIVLPGQLGDPTAPMTVTRAQEVYQIALGNQPNIKAAELRISSAEYDLKIAKGNKMPSLGLQAGIFTGYSNNRQLATGDKFLSSDTVGVELDGNLVPLVFFQEVPIFGSYPFLNQLWDQRNYSISIGLSVPIYSRGFFNNQIQQSEIRMQNAQLNSEIQKQGLKQNIQQAYLDVRSAYSTFNATKKQIESLETTFRNSEKQYNLGVINAVDYLLVKNNLNRAQNDLSRTKYDFIFKTKILDFFEGKPITLE